MDSNGLIEETILITAINGDWMTVERLDGNAACSGCAQACPSGSLKRLMPNSATRWRLPTQETARPGDIWRVGVSPEMLLRGATRVYVLPLIGLLLGAILGNSAAGDVGAALGGVAGFALLLASLWLFRPASREISPIFIKKIHSA